MWTPDVIKMAVKEAYELLSTGHHTKGSLAVNEQGASVPVTSPEAVKFCEWGAIDRAIFMLEVVEYGSDEFKQLENQINDVINAANPSAQYDKYRSQNGDQHVTFEYNDGVLSTEQVVERFKNALDLCDQEPELVKALTTNPVKSAKPKSHTFAMDDVI